MRHAFLRPWNRLRARGQIRRWLEPAEDSLDRLRQLLEEVGRAPGVAPLRRTEIVALVGVSAGQLRGGLHRLGDDAGREAILLVGTLEWLGEFIALADREHDRFVSASAQHC